MVYKGRFCESNWGLVESSELLEEGVRRTFEDTRLKREHLANKAIFGRGQNIIDRNLDRRTAYPTSETFRRGTAGDLLNVVIKTTSLFPYDGLQIDGVPISMHLRFIGIYDEVSTPEGSSKEECREVKIEGKQAEKRWWSQIAKIRGTFRCSFEDMLISDAKGKRVPFGSESYTQVTRMVTAVEAHFGTALYKPPSS